MELLKVSGFITRNDDRTAAENAQAEAYAEKQRAQVIGDAILAGKTLEEATAAGEAATKAALKDVRTWYEVDTDGVYPAAVKWLKANGAALIMWSTKPEAEVAIEAFKGNSVAKFALLCRAYANQTLINVPIDGWELALLHVNDVSEAELPIRELALEAARLFVTEIIHQAIEGKPMGVHFSKSEWFRLKPSTAAPAELPETAG